MTHRILALLLFLIPGGAGAVHADPPGAPRGLLCELLRFPEDAVITDATPEFGWIVDDPRRGAVQSAYQILVASGSDGLENDEGDVWDSGKVSSDRSIDVAYKGHPLAPHTTYWWKVRTWDGEGVASPYSEVQAFRTGDFEEGTRSFPGQSRWVQLDDGRWVLENRQRGEYHEIAPREVVRLGDGHYLADFGRAAFATLRFTATSPAAGDSVIVFLGERKQEDGTVHKNPGRSNIGFKRVAVALEQGRHRYTVELPRHVSHYPNSQVLAEHMLEVAPFRYVELVGGPTMEASDLTQLALFYPFDDSAAHFASSDDRLDRVWELSKYTLKATPFLSLYMDGNRERMPYEADSYIQQLGHYAVDREFAVARYTLDFLLFNASWPTEWQMHTVLMAWADYMATGNTELIEAYYDELKAKTLLALAGPDGLISTQTGLVTPEFLRSIHFEGNDFRDIVDWPPGRPAGAEGGSHQGLSPEGERDGYVFTPINTVVNAFHFRSLVLMAEMAEAIERPDDARFYRERATQVKERFNVLLLDRERGIYVDGDTTRHTSLHANLFPLAFGLVPEEVVPTVVAHIESRGMAASVYGAQYLLDALYNAGASRYALELMTSDTKRSWLNMIRVGSTMTTEAWDELYKPNLTWNHAWGSAPANVVARRLMGITPLEPAYRRLQIRPQPGGLRSVDLRTPTIRGAVETTWRADGDRYELSVTIPANTRAEVWLPGASIEGLAEGGATLDGREDIRHAGSREGYQVFEIGAGSHAFSGPASALAGIERGR